MQVQELPEIETARLRLRVYRADDHAALHRITSRPETFEFSERGPMSCDESWSRLLRHAGHWALVGHGLFAVEEKATGELVGEVGLADFRRGLGPAFDGFPEASWTLAKDVWGRGYAYEAALAAHEWTAQRLGIGRSVCLIHRDNACSFRLADRLGYVAFAEAAYRGYPAVMMERG